MSRSASTLDFDVLIVSAGPTGSALAGDLGRGGKRVLLLEQTDGVVLDARLHTVNTCCNTYDPERRAAVTRSAGLASSIYQDWVETRLHIPAPLGYHYAEYSIDAEPEAGEP